MEIEDISALVTIVGCFVLMAMGIKTDVMTGVLLTATGFMFGKHSKKRVRKVEARKGRRGSSGKVIGNDA